MEGDELHIEVLWVDSQATRHQEFVKQDHLSRVLHYLYVLRLPA